MSQIKLVGVSKIYTKPYNREVLKEINLTIEKGELIAIIGPSGSGKSTLLNIIGGMDTQSKGRYSFGDMEIDKLNHNDLSKFRNKNIGFIFQNFFLLKGYSIYENVNLPMIHRKDIGVIEKRSRIKKLLKAVGMEDEMKKKPSQLSGGQQQRVAIARALINNPEIILADEPTGSLDNDNGDKILSMLKNINKQGKTVIIVTHDIKVANQCDRIIKLDDGKIIS